ncbi:45722_t:CDS:2, partial [Gigaspora margarita]
MFQHVKLDIWKYEDKETYKCSQFLKPFKVIEEKAFRNMFQRLDQFYKILSCKTIQKLAINQFNLIKNYFSKISNKHFVLDTLQFKSSYTRESIANKVYSFLEEFKIKTKVIVLTTDN